MLQRLHNNLIAAGAQAGCSSKEIQQILEVEHGETLRYERCSLISYNEITISLLFLQYAPNTTNPKKQGSKQQKPRKSIKPSAKCY